MTGLCIVPFAIYYCSSWNDTLFNFFDSMIYHSWVTIVEFCTAYILYLASIISVSFSLFKIKKWISAELAEPFGRRWRCLKDGLFLVYLALICLIFGIDVAIGTLAIKLIQESPIAGDSVDLKYMEYNELLIIFTTLTFLATSFILAFMIKMSRAVWSSDLPEEEMNGKTSMMDREVAGGWFDRTKLDTNY